MPQTRRFRFGAYRIPRIGFGFRYSDFPSPGFGFSSSGPTGRSRVPTPITLRGEHITLAQAVKVAGLADTGGQAKLLVRAGKVRVNGSREERPGHKLHAGD